MSDERLFLICALADRPAVIPGTEVTSCVECEADILIAPSGREIIEEKGAEPVCGKCAMGHENPVTMPLTPEQLAEFHRWQMRPPI